jgi:alkylation response protein AidB-like acyl-CoA dehydrogenase
MRTTAVKHGDKWVINGTKNWITNADVADFLHRLRRHRSRGRTRGRVRGRADRPGFSIGGYEHTLEIKGSPTGSPVLEDVRVPHESVIGEVGRGMHVALGTLERTRLGAAAQAVGIAQGATDYAVQYAKERIAFGKPIIDLQGIQYKPADMQTGTAASRELLNKACTLADCDPVPGDLGAWTSMAKLFASDNAMKVTVEATQVHGGFGYANDYPSRADDTSTPRSPRSTKGPTRSSAS